MKPTEKYYRKEEIKKRYLETYLNRPKPKRISDKAWGIYLDIMTSNNTYSTCANKYGVTSSYVRESILRVDRHLRHAVRIENRELQTVLTKQDKVIVTLDSEVQDLFSNRAVNQLIKNNIDTLRKVCDLTLEELSDIPNIGRLTIDGIVKTLDEYGFFLKPSYQEIKHPHKTKEIRTRIKKGTSFNNFSCKSTELHERYTSRKDFLDHGIRVIKTLLSLRGLPYDYRKGIERSLDTISTYYSFLSSDEPLSSEWTARMNVITRAITYFTYHLEGCSDNSTQTPQ